MQRRATTRCIEPEADPWIGSLDHGGHVALLHSHLQPHAIPEELRSRVGFIDGQEPRIAVAIARARVVRRRRLLASRTQTHDCRQRERDKRPHLT